jgi:hypothetical protein
VKEGKLKKNKKQRGFASPEGNRSVAKKRDLGVFYHGCVAV